MISIKDFLSSFEILDSPKWSKQGHQMVLYIDTFISEGVNFFDFTLVPFIRVIVWPLNLSVIALVQVVVGDSIQYSLCP